jgi:UDP-2,4-diacetamido-2,4,6-trideoxy-beta-L-altropyranose hydrolase
MRVLTLAKELRNRNAYCKFVCREHEGHLIDLIRQADFEVSVLSLHTPPFDLQNKSQSAHLSPYANWLGADVLDDAEETIIAIKGSRPDWLVVDHYAIDHRWESALRPYVDKILVIDDLANRLHDCDMLLDQNLKQDYLNCYDTLVPNTCTKLLGPDYALLQPQYAELHPKTPPRLDPIQRIFVYFGAADNCGLTVRTLKALKLVIGDDVAVDVILNKTYPDYQEIRTFAFRNINLHETVPSLALMMVRADLAIGACGATSWERCCLGLPSLVITLADNQIPIANELAKQGLVEWLGNHDNVTTSDIARSIQEVLDKSDRFRDWSSQCRQLLDGKGTLRTADVLALDASTILHAREALVADEAILLKWANDPVVRQNGFNPALISPTTHKKWFYKRLRSTETCQIYIIETMTRLPIGQVRFELSDDRWELHYSISAIARGRRLGKNFLYAALSAFQKKHKVSSLFARVKPSNISSQKILSYVGFEKRSESNTEIAYRLQL